MEVEEWDPLEPTCLESKTTLFTRWLTTSSSISRAHPCKSCSFSCKQPMVMDSIDIDKEEPQSRSQGRLIGTLSRFQRPAGSVRVTWYRPFPFYRPRRTPFLSDWVHLHRQPVRIERRQGRCQGSSKTMFQILYLPWFRATGCFISPCKIAWSTRRTPDCPWDK